MATACRIRPLVKNKQGQFVESQLHNDLNCFINNKEVLDHTWSVLHSEDYSSKEGFHTDNNGEITFEDALGKTSAGALVSDDALAKGLNIIHEDQESEATPQGFRSVARKAVEFNEKSPLSNRTQAILNTLGRTAKVVYGVGAARNSETARKLKDGLELADVLDTWLRDNGFAVDYLYEAEEGQGIDGVTDFSATKRAADGFVHMIRIAKGIAGRIALPEETSHTVIGNLAGRNAHVDRVLSLLRNNEALVKEILGAKYDEYHSNYKGNTEKLIHEAAGHILTDMLNEEFTKDKYGEAYRYKSLFQRMVDAIKEFFSKLKNDRLADDMMKLRSSSRVVARQILDNSCYVAPDFSTEVKSLGQLFALSDDMQKKLEDIGKRLERDTKSRMRKIPASIISYNRRRYGNRGFYDTLDELYKNIQDQNARGYNLNAICMYLSQASHDLKYNLDTFQSRFDKSSKLDNKAWIAENLSTMCKTYERVLEDIYAIIDEVESSVESEDYKSTVRDLRGFLNGYTNSKGEFIPGLSALIANCKGKAQRVKLPLFIEYVSKFINLDNIYVPAGGTAYGFKEGEKVSLSKLMQESSDMGFLDFWLGPASAANNLPIQVFQRILDKQTLECRQDWIEINKELKELTYDLEKAGYKNQEFMFVRDKDGKLTGKYIDQNSKEYQDLSQKQKDYYNAVLEIKQRLDAMLPDKLTELLNAPKIRKDFMEQLERKDKKMFDAIKDKIEEAWKIRSDDEYNLMSDTAIVDYDGNSIDVIPIRFLSFAAGEDMNDMSTDVVSTMTRYAQMCCNYSAMSRIAPILELGRSVLQEGKTTKEVNVVDKYGNKTTATQATVRSSENGNRILKRTDDIFKSRLYGFKTENIETEILGKKISLTAVGQKMLAMTAMNQYMLSIDAAIQNTITARLQHVITGTQGKYFDMSDLTWAIGVYNQNLLTMLNDSFDRIKSSKIALFNEMFNVLQKDHTQVFNHKGLKRYEWQDNYVLTSMGEFNANTVIALAIAHRTKMKDANGKETNLFDAFEVVDMAEKTRREIAELRSQGRNEQAEIKEKKLANHPEWTNSQNKFLVVKKGYKKEDGNDFTFKSNKEMSDLVKFTRKSMHCAHVLNGVYNTEDAARWQRFIGCQMFGMYRKWMYMMWYRRINGLNYSLDEEEWTEGYYRTAFRVLYMRARALFDKDIAAKIQGQELQQFEKQNLRIAFSETLIWTALAFAVLLLKTSDRKKRSFAYNKLYYFAVRTFAEANALTVQGMTKETLRLFQNPSAVLPVMDNMLGLVGTTLNPQTYGFFGGDAYVQSGKYKGWSKEARAIVRVTPVLKPFLSFMNPSESARFYE